MKDVKKMIDEELLTEYIQLNRKIDLITKNHYDGNDDLPDYTLYDRVDELYDELDRRTPQ